MAQIMNVRLSRSDNSPWGFRLQGGKDFGTPLVIQKVNMGSIAENAGLIAGDTVIKVNNTEVFNLRHKDAQDVIVRAGASFEIVVQRGGSTWKPSVIPTGPMPSPQSNVNNVSPVTRTSLASSKPAASPIGTGHNLAAKPFNSSPQQNGDGPRLVNKQYNTPVGLYSEESIAETLSAQTEVLSTGVLGVNFKKNEKHYDSTKSDVFRMLQEAEREPKEQELEAEKPSAFPHITAPTSGPAPAPQSPAVAAVAGLRHVAPPEAKAPPAQAPQQQLPPGQNICADCERLIVGVFVRIKDKNLHVECFKCATCGSSLKNVGYYNINNKLYCDIHAKLAAKTNPPAPNLIPVTLPPGKAPATISAALATHSLPSPGQLSPLATNQNSYAAPFQQHEPTVKALKLKDDVAVHKLLNSLSVAANKKKESLNGGTNGYHPHTKDTGTFVSEKVIPINNNVYYNVNNNTNGANKLESKAYSPVVGYNKYLQKTGANLSSPRPFMSVNSPISPPAPAPFSANIPSLIKAPVAPPSSAPVCESDVVICETNTPAIPQPETPKGNVLQNISWPPVQPVEELPTASPLYFPPPEIIAAHPPTLHLQQTKESDEQSYDFSTQQEEQSCYQQYSEEITNDTNKIVNRQLALDCVDTISNTLDTQMLVNSVLKEKTKASTAEMNQYVNYSSSNETSSYQQNVVRVDALVKTYPPSSSMQSTPLKVDVGETQSKLSSNMEQSSLLKISENGCARDVSASPDCPLLNSEKIQPIIDQVTVVINNPLPDSWQQKVTENSITNTCMETETNTSSSFSAIENSVALGRQSPFIEALQTVPSQALIDICKIPTKKSHGVLASALAIAPLEPFNPAPPTSLEPIPLPEETVPYFPPADLFKIELPEFTQPPAQKKRSKWGKPAPVVPEENFLKDLPPPPSTKISMLTALTTAPDRPFSPIACLNQVETPVSEHTTLEEPKLPPVKACELPKLEPPKQEAPKPESETAKVAKPLAFKPVKPLEPFKPKEVDYQPPVIPELEIEEEEEPAAPETEPAPEPEPQVPEIVREIIKPQEVTEYVKPMQFPLHRPDYVPPYQTSVNDLTSVTQSIKTLEINKEKKFQIPTRKPITTVLPGQHQPSSPQMSFQPVSETGSRPSSRLNTSRPVSSMGKTPPVIPYYQLSIVPTHHLAVGSTLYDPRSTTPSPHSHAEVHEATFGPPQNPLDRGVQEEQSYRMEHEAQQTLTNFIPHYQERLDEANRRVCASPKNIQSANAFSTSQSSQSCKVTSTPIPKGILKTSTSETSEMRHLEEQNATNRETVQRIGDMEVKRTKKSTEEFERTQTMKTIEIAKSSTTFGSSANASILNEEYNLSSTQKAARQKMPVNVIQELKNQQQRQPQQNDPQKPLTEIQLKVSVPNPQGRLPTIATQSNFVPPTPAPCARPPISIPTPLPKPSTSSTTGPPISTQNYVPLPYSGASGGRQTGAAISAPKRGRGVLNAAAVPGSRVALCGACNQNIRGPFITALGKIWCPEHFVCTTPSCRRHLQDLGFVEEQGHLYCEFCFEQYLAPNCGKCSAKIKGDCLKAIGKHFHPECFNCAYCGKLFGNNPFFLEDGLPYCETDWNELFTTKCFACGFPVEAGDRWVEALNNNYHSQCFNCTMCKKNLEGQSFFAKGGRPFCKNHAR